MGSRLSSLAWLRAIVAVGILLCASSAGDAALILAASGPAGNDGTVKVHEGAGEPTPVTRDDPHVCTFHLHFLFGDAGQTGSWRIEAWPPTGDRSVVLFGTYRTGADGQDRQPETGAYSLTDGHYKLSWQGSSVRTWKQKVFWVECAPPSPSPSPSRSSSARTSPSPGAESPPAQASASGTGEVEAIVVTPPPTDLPVLSPASARTIELIVLLLLVFSAAVQTSVLVALVRAPRR